MPLLLLLQVQPLLRSLLSAKIHTFLYITTLDNRSKVVAQTAPPSSPLAVGIISVHKLWKYHKLQYPWTTSPLLEYCEYIHHKHLSYYLSWYLLPLLLLLTVLPVLIGVFDATINTFLYITTLDSGSKVGAQTAPSPPPPPLPHWRHHIRIWIYKRIVAP